jgi:hypothetical protein
LCTGQQNRRTAWFSIQTETNFYFSSSTTTCGVHEPNASFIPGRLHQLGRGHALALIELFLRYQGPIVQEKKDKSGNKKKKNSGK